MLLCCDGADLEVKRAKTVAAERLAERLAGNRSFWGLTFVSLLAHQNRAYTRAKGHGCLGLCKSRGLIGATACKGPDPEELGTGNSRLIFTLQAC